MNNLTHKNIIDGRNFEIRMSNNYKEIIILCDPRRRNQEEGIHLGVYSKIVIALEKIEGKIKTDNGSYEACHIHYKMPQTKAALQSFLQKVSECTNPHLVTVDSNIPLD